MTNKNELNEKELEKVSGGVSHDTVNRYLELKRILKNEISKHAIANYINQDLLFDFDEGIDWIYGTLLNKYEESALCGHKPMARIKVIESGDYTSGETVDICLNNFRFFTK